MIREEGISFQSNPINGKLSELPHGKLMIAIGNTLTIWPQIKKLKEDLGLEHPFEEYSKKNAGEFMAELAKIGVEAQIHFSHNYEPKELLSFQRVIQVLN